MTSMAAAIALAAAVDTLCDVEHSLPTRPAKLSHKSAFVAPGEPWKQREDFGWCRYSVGLDVYLVAAAGQQVPALEWLDEQSTILIEAEPIDVGDDTVHAGPVDPPFLFTSPDGSSHLICRVTYSRFTIGDDEA